MTGGNTHIVPDDPDHFYYFAYGSNLCAERLHLLNPSAVFLCNGVLNGYRLGFGGRSRTWGGSAATIVEDEQRIVCGVVWKLRNEHSSTLDLQESNYRRLSVDVRILPIDCADLELRNGHIAHLPTIRCRTYQMMDVQSPTPCLPSPHYKRVIVFGSKEHQLPLEYHKFLESMPDNGYDGPVLVRLSIFENWQVDKKIKATPTDL